MSNSSTHGNYGAARSIIYVEPACPFGNYCEKRWCRGAELNRRFLPLPSLDTTSVCQLFRRLLLLRLHRAERLSDTNKVSARKDSSCQSGIHPRRYTWAELLKRVFEVDVLSCPRCGGRMRVLCAINLQPAIQKILACIGLPTRAPPIAHAISDEDEFYQYQYD
jgi:hypothetical protein